MSQFLNDPELQRILSTFIVGRMKELGWDYKRLSAELQNQYGIEQSPGNLKSKIYRGNFKGTLLLILYWVLGIDQHTMNRARAIYQQTLDKNRANQRKTDNRTDDSGSC
ncbi:DUF6471 domain-containing protein [Motiliproteus sp. MSK22-1]|uniref:DUF6471 domain-containing protein n=1 Tax=Motiliproteus sp. MSK22-1 TaxID=1897630 RepID=UPI0009786CF8|nr:DUF6471 domain-containing protein [Motiliproteus sp. MSK22-1]OMH33781.1 hypothetical protein BGP75_12375 [Motiliproteus sp. MSK22-1]